METKFDYIVIGSGPAGHVSAIKAAQLGLKTAVIEKGKDMFGGVCLNEGCIPAKSLYNSAEIYNTVKHGSELCGLDAPGGNIDMGKIVAKSREDAKRLAAGLTFIFKKNSIELISGEASFSDRGRLSVTADGGEESVLEAEKFLISTGSAPVSLSDIPFDGEHVITSSQAIRLDKVPESIVIVGGGAIGTELASFFNMIGSAVTIVEVEDSLLPLEDKEISKRLQSIFKKKGITVLTSSRLKSASGSGGSVKVSIEGPGGETSGVYDKVLLAVGRRPSTSDIGLDRIGVKADEAGFIPVDFMMQTNVKGIYAAGDVVRSPMLAHVAYAEGYVAAVSAAGGAPDAIDYQTVPNVVYTDVPVASVGLTEEKAKSEGVNVKTGKQFFKANGRAVVNGRTDGFVKVVADANTHKVLGAHIIGHEAPEIIHEFALARRAGLAVEDIEKTVHAHPTFSETVLDACKAVFGDPIHG